MDLTKYRPAYREGYQARESGLTRADCPHAIERHGANAIWLQWTLGWAAANARLAEEGRLLLDAMEAYAANESLATA